MNPKYQIIEYLREHDGIKLGDLAKAIQRQRAVVWDLVDSLTADGYTRREYGKNRVISVFLTDKGREADLQAFARYKARGPYVAKVGEWRNPYAGLPYLERLDAIQAAAIKAGTCYTHAAQAPTV